MRGGSSRNVQDRLVRRIFYFFYNNAIYIRFIIILVVIIMISVLDVDRVLNDFIYLTVCLWLKA